MAVADVPVARLALRGREGERATLSECLTIGGGSCHHVVVLLSVGCHDGGEVRCFVHAVSMAADGGQWGEWWTLPQLSHQEGGRVAVVSDDVTEGVSDLSVSELLRQVQAKQHGTVQVGRGLVLLRSRGADDFVCHVDIIGTAWGDLGSLVDSAPTGSAAASFVQLWVV